MPFVPLPFVLPGPRDVWGKTNFVGGGGGEEEGGRGFGLAGCWPCFYFYFLRGGGGGGGGGGEGRGTLAFWT